MSRFTAIIILQYQNAFDTIECIKSVEQYNTAPIKYIIVDNGSANNDSVATLSSFINSWFKNEVIEVNDDFKVKESLPKVTFLKSKVNDGYACGNNKGLHLAYCDGEIDNILILNNDILFVEDIISKMIVDLEVLSKCAIVSPLLYKKGLMDLDPNCARYEGRVRDTIIYNLLLLRTTKRIRRATYIPLLSNSGCVVAPLISGSCIMCKKELLRSIGSFDPGTFLYCEENILWEKIKRIDRLNYVDTEIKCIHIGAATIGKYRSVKLIRQAFKSQNYFVRNYLPHGRFKVAILKITNVWVLTILSIVGLIKKIYK